MKCSHGQFKKQGRCIGVSFFIFSSLYLNPVYHDIWGKSAITAMCHQHNGGFFFLLSFLKSLLKLGSWPHFACFSYLFIFHSLTLKRLGGPLRPPLNILCDYSATGKALGATLYDFFLSSFPHILTPNLWRPGVRFWSYVTFCTCTSDRNWLQNVILFTKSMQIDFFRIVHINMLIFTLNGWN